jgi:hypothetical protein
MMGMVEITRPTSCAPTEALKVATQTKTEVMKRVMGSPIKLICSVNVLVSEVVDLKVILACQTSETMTV